MKKIIAINGESWARNLTGIERVASDTVQYLDALFKSGEAELIVPQNIKRPAAFKNIKTVTLPVDATFFPKWTQIHFQKYVIQNKRLSLDFSNTCPFFAPGIEFLHDIYAHLYPSDFTKSRRDRLIHFYSNLMYRRIAKKAKKIIAVSEYTRQTIIESYRVRPERVEVVYDGLGSYKDIQPDSGVFERLPELEKRLDEGEGGFYFTLGSLSTRKNLSWIARHAELYPNDFFAVSGKPLPSVVPPELEKLRGQKNILMTGYLSDGEVKALLQKCKAFVFPSYFEGFGLPPLEALSCGAPIIISDKTSLPEIYGGSAHYIDPDNPDVDLDNLLKEAVEPPSAVLEKYTLEKSARRLYEVIQQVNV